MEAEIFNEVEHQRMLRQSKYGIPTGDKFNVNEEPRCYKIVRYFYGSGRKRVIKHNVTLKIAQLHCSDPRTKRQGVWFDGYDWERGCKP